ncbi:MAG TPA: TatD family hydrolase [Spirochaetota bacterium]|nr:TatD family hydrolase [Spirochaetota bacterium]HPI88388.1 TatD family hydrolase [Spirochaetota bacterium]HPR46754.1 TatD family hydrolase [Spirochaetota bacterium]
MVIDFHTHLFAPDVISHRDAYLSDRHFALLNTDPASRLAGHTEALAACAEDGIDFMVAMGFAWHSASFCQRQNRYFAELPGLTGGKIIPFGSVPLDDKKNIAGWVREIRAAGLAGIGEVAFYAEGMTNENTDFLYALFDRARATSLPLCLHVNEPVGHEYPGKYEPSLARLYAILAQYRDVTVILSHWGGGLFAYELMPEVRETLDRCYYDTAATPYLYRNTVYTVALEIIGGEKILFGSDYPLIRPKRYITTIAESVSDEKTRKRILGGNAARILGIS